MKYQEMINIVVNELNKDLIELRKDYSVHTFSAFLIAQGWDSEDLKEEVNEILHHELDDKYRFFDCDTYQDINWTQIKKDIKKGLGF